jgi:chromosome partitioning protein
MRIAITNLKGGVGKTTITINLAVALANRNYSVCIVDTDLGQKSSMEWAGSREADVKLIPVFGVVGKQLNREVGELNSKYDLVLIDGTPQLSELAERTILASDMIVIPISPSILDFRAFESFFERCEQINDLKESQGLKRSKIYVVVNRIIERANISQEILNALQNYEVTIFETRLNNRVAYAESITQGLGVVEYRDKKAKQEIDSLADEFEKALKLF